MLEFFGLIFTLSFETALFRQGINTRILAVVVDKRFTNPLKAMIGGIKSNIVNGILWFIIKPNYFISVNDPNLEDTLELK